MAGENSESNPSRNLIMEELINTPPKTLEPHSNVVTLPKCVYEDVLAQLFGMATTSFRLSDLISDEPLFGCTILTALEMMGYGEYQAPDRFRSNVYQIVDYHTAKIKKPINQTDTRKVGRKIYKDVLVEINKLKRNPRHYE